MEGNLIIACERVRSMEISYEELCELIKQEMEDEWREMLEDERVG